MKNMRLVTILAVFLLMGVLLGCNVGVDKAASNKAVVLAALDAMNNHQYDVLDQYFAADFHRYSQATPDVEINSLDDMIVFIKDWYRAFPDAQMEIRLVAAEDDLVAVWLTFAGTHQAPMGLFPATGKRMESETFGFFRLEQGKIKESWVTWDNVAGLTQLGLFPPPAQDQNQETP
jgi:steroid delta-isomerase-like uncharacterized protein